MKYSYFILFLTLSFVIVGANPYFRRNVETEEVKIANTVEVSVKANEENLPQKKSFVIFPQFVRNILTKITTIQRNFHRKISSNMRVLRDDASVKTLFMVGFFSFLYGLIHSLGPGHGKVIIGSYFLANKSKVWHGVLAGTFMAFMHALSATVVVFIFYIVLKRSMLATSAQIDLIMKNVTSFLIIFLGLFLIWNEFFRKSKHFCDNDSEFITEKYDKKALMLSLFAGLVPCPGVTLVYLFSINLGILRYGIVSVISTTLGMAAGISGVAVLVISARGFAEKILSKEKTGSSNKISYLFKTVKFTGFVIIILSGIVMIQI